MFESCAAKGYVRILVEDNDRKYHLEFPNQVLRTGKNAIARSFANDFGTSFDYFITGISFGSGGTLGGVPRKVEDTRTGLFGPLVTTKSVISSVSSTNTSLVTFTTVLTWDDAVGSTINEIALKMKNGDYFSMATFGDITKTSSMQMTLNWEMMFV